MLERLRELRNALNLTQVEFGEKLSMKKSNWCMIENGNRNITDRTINSICAIFGVNENWLRYGDGEMFTVTNESILNEVSNRYRLGEIERKILEIYLELPEPNRGVIIDYIKRIAESITNEEAEPQAYKIARSDSNDGKPHPVSTEDVKKLRDAPEDDTL